MRSKQAFSPSSSAERKWNSSAYPIKPAFRPAVERQSSGGENDRKTAAPVSHPALQGLLLKAPEARKNVAQGVQPWVRRCKRM